MQKKEPLLSARGLCKSFAHNGGQVHILSGMDLDIYAGDFTVIMGASGSGKSTLLYALSGMDRATAGTVLYGGGDLVKMKEKELTALRRKDFGFVFQQIYLIDKMNLLDNVITAGSLTSKNKADIVRRANALFDMVNISETTRRKLPSLISGGEAQRAGIVRAAINEPAAIFADEPTGALNSYHSDAVLDVFSKLNANGQSIIMVTHDKKSALRGNRVVYIKDGAICGDCDLGAYKEADSARTEKLETFLKDMGW